MAKRWWQYTVYLCCAWFALGTASARASRQFQSISIEQGLSQSVVNSISQDTQGFLWFGTQDGLNRYDGVQFKVYRHQDSDPHSLPGNDILRLQTDHRGELWIGTGAGAAYLPAYSEQFEVLPLAPDAGTNSIDKMVLSFAFGAGPEVWLGTANGLWRYDRLTKKISAVAARDTLSLLTERRVRELYFEQKNARLWIGTDKGVQWLDVASGQWRSPPRLQGLAITRLLSLDDERMLLGTRQGLYLYLRSSDSLSTLAAGFANCGATAIGNAPVQDLLRDSNSDVWLASAEGVVVSAPDFQHCELYQRSQREPHSLNSNDVLSLYEDRSGVLWFGTYAGGLNRWNTRAKLFHPVLATEREPEISATRAVMATLRDSHGDLWIGSNDLGLLHKRHGEQNFRPVDLQSAYRLAQVNNDPAKAAALGSVVTERVDIDITVLLEDQFGDLWIGTNIGLFQRKADAVDDRAIRLMNGPLQLDTNSYVSSLFEDSHGQLWLGNYSGYRQIVRGPRNTFSVDIFDHKLPAQWRASVTEITSISDDRYRNLWLAGAGGVLRVNAKRNQYYRYHADADANKAERLPSNDVLSLYVGVDDSIWLGTSNGLARLHTQDGEHYFSERFNADSGYPIASVYGLLPGTDASLWLATNAGLVRFDTVQHSISRFRREDGLLSDEFNVRAHSINANGERLFGGIGGVIGFYDQELAPVKPMAPPMLVGWRKFDHVQPLPAPDAAVRINSDERVLIFDYAVPDYVAPARNQLRYRVHGLHDNWISLEGSRSITLTGLAPQKYQLEVQGISAGGQVSESSFLNLNVHGPFWSFHRLYLSLMALALVLMATILAWFNRRFRRALARERLAVVNANQDLQLMQRDNSELRQLHKTAQTDLDFCHQQQQELAQQLDQVSSIDMLTGLSNRYGLLTALGSRLEQGQCAGLLLLDLDGVRGINERFGWAVGDQVLVQLADMLARMQSERTLIFRVYADVFALLPPAQTELKSLAERIRSAVLQKAFHIAGRRRVDMTCCIGFVVLKKSAVLAGNIGSDPEPVVSANIELFSPMLIEHAPEILLALAERGVALAKKNGRNAWVGFQLDEQLGTMELKREWPHSLELARQTRAITVITSLPGGADSLRW